MGNCFSVYTFNINNIHFETDHIPQRSHYQNEYTTRYNNIEIVKYVEYGKFILSGSWLKLIHFEDKESCLLVKQGVSVLIENDHAYIGWFQDENYNYVFERLERIYKNSDTVINDVINKQYTITRNIVRLTTEVLESRNKSMIVNANSNDNIKKVKKEQLEIYDKMLLV